MAKCSAAAREASNASNVSALTCQGLVRVALEEVADCDADDGSRRSVTQRVSLVQVRTALLMTAAQDDGSVSRACMVRVRTFARLGVDAHTTRLQFTKTSTPSKTLSPTISVVALCQRSLEGSQRVQYALAA